MKTLLLIESSTPHASLGLWRDGSMVFDASFESDRHHNALLFEPLKEAITRLGDAQLDEIIVGTGPGSYSGTRVGIAAAQGVALVHDCPVVGLSSLAALGVSGGWVIGDARRGSAWWATLGDALPEPQLVDASALAETISRPTYALEDVSKLDLPADFDVERVSPTAAGLAAAWLGLDEPTRSQMRTVPPQPAYLRPPHITAAKKGHPLLRK